MICKYCETPMIPERDPYGTGDHWYVVYEPACNCENTIAREGSVEAVKKSLLENHENYMKKLEENKCE